MSEPSGVVEPGDRARFIVTEKTTALRAARAGVWNYDPSTDRFCYCLGAARAFGLPGEARFTGLPLASLAGMVHPDDRQIYLARVAPILKRGGAVDARLRTEPAGGRSRRLLMRGDVTPGDGPHDIHASGIVVELDADDPPEPATHDRASAGSDLIDGIDHILAARACLANLVSRPGHEALPLVDLLLRSLGGILAEDAGERG